MHEILDTTRVAIAVIVTAVLAALGIVMATTASRAEIDHLNDVTRAQQLFEERDWSKYTGTVRGSDVIDFILVHKHTCDVVIRNSSKLKKFEGVIPITLAGTSLILSDNYVYTKQGAVVDPKTSEKLYSLEYLYNYVIDPSATFEGLLLYDGALTVNDSETHTAITGIQFVEMSGG